MIVSVNDPASRYEAFQASLFLKRAHKRLNKTVIEALIRERLELVIAQKSAWWLMSDGLTEGCRQVQSWMKEQLAVHGLELENLELVGIHRSPTAEPREDLVATYQECWLDRIPTSDGFELTLSVVIRSWVPPALAGKGNFSGVDADLLSLAQQFFSQRDSETALGDVALWQSQLRPVLEQMEEAYRVASGLLEASKTGLFRQDKRICSDSCWVTRRQLKPGKRAFAPGQRYGYLDPYHLFYMLKDRKQLHELYRSGRG
jgi:hypothetical protein